MQKQQNKFISNLKLLQGGSLEEYNEYLKQLLLERNISASLEFNLGQLQQCIDQEGTFGPLRISCLFETVRKTIR